MAPPRSASVLLVVLGPPLLVAQGLPLFAPKGLQSSAAQEFPPPAVRGLHSSAVHALLRLPLIDPLRACFMEAPSCSAEEPSELRHRQTNRTPRSFVVDWSDHRQVICCLVCGEQQPLFSSSSRLARLPPASSPRFSLIPGEDSPSNQHPYLQIPRKRQWSFLQVELVVVHPLPVANHFLARPRNTLPCPVNGSSHE